MTYQCSTAELLLAIDVATRARQDVARLLFPLLDHALSLSEEETPESFWGWTTGELYHRIRTLYPEARFPIEYLREAIMVGFAQGCLAPCVEPGATEMRYLRVEARHRTSVHV